MRGAFVWRGASFPREEAEDLAHLTSEEEEGAARLGMARRHGAARPGAARRCLRRGQGGQGRAGKGVGRWPYRCQEEAP